MVKALRPVSWDTFQPRNEPLVKNCHGRLAYGFFFLHSVYPNPVCQGAQGCRLRESPIMNQTRLEAEVEPVPAGSSLVVASAGPKPSQAGIAFGKGCPSVVRRLGACLFFVALPALSVIAWGYVRFGSASAMVAVLSGHSLAVSPGVQHLGKVSGGEHRTTRFAVRNLTSRTVRILGASSHCGCVVVSDLPLDVRAGTSPAGTSGSSQLESTSRVPTRTAANDSQKRVDRAVFI